MKGAFTGFGGEIAKLTFVLVGATSAAIGYVLTKQGLDYAHSDSFKAFVISLLKYDAIAAVFITIGIIVEKLFFKEKVRD